MFTCACDDGEDRANVGGCGSRECDCARAYVDETAPCRNGGVRDGNHRGNEREYALRPSAHEHGGGSLEIANPMTREARHQL